jgi:hypothetical protein
MAAADSLGLQWAAMRKKWCALPRSQFCWFDVHRKDIRKYQPPRRQRRPHKRSSMPQSGTYFVAWGPAILYRGAGIALMRPQFLAASSNRFRKTIGQMA